MLAVLSYARLIVWLLLLLPPVALWQGWIDVPASVGVFFALLAVAEVLGHFRSRRIEEIRKQMFVDAWFEAGGDTAAIEEIDAPGSVLAGKMPTQGPQ